MIGEKNIAIPKVCDFGGGANQSRTERRHKIWFHGGGIQKKIPKSRIISSRIKKKWKKLKIKKSNNPLQPNPQPEVNERSVVVRHRVDVKQLHLHLLLHMDSWAPKQPNYFTKGIIVIIASKIQMHF